MSLIIDAIKRISVIAERNRLANVPGYFLATWKPYPSERYVTPQELSREQLDLISSYCNPKPRVTLSEIRELTSQCRYSIPQEIYDLYQLGNGCLPIGTSENKDWDSIYNYYFFPSGRYHLVTLSTAVDYVVHCHPQLWPISYHGEHQGLFAVLGAEESEETAPLVWAYKEVDDVDDVSSLSVDWPSLSNMMLAYAEYLEALYDRSLKVNVKEIYSKYGNGQDLNSSYLARLFAPY